MGFFDLFPPKLKIEKRKSVTASVFFVSGRRFCEEIIGEMLGFLDYFSYLCRSNRDATATSASAQHSSSKLGSAFT